MDNTLVNTEGAVEYDIITSYYLAMRSLPDLVVYSSMSCPGTHETHYANLFPALQAIRASIIEAFINTWHSARHILVLRGDAAISLNLGNTNSKLPLS